MVRAGLGSVSVVCISACLHVCSSARLLVAEKEWVKPSVDSGSVLAISNSNGFANFRVRIDAARSGEYSLSLEVTGVAPVKVRLLANRSAHVTRELRVRNTPCLSFLLPLTDGLCARFLDCVLDCLLD